MSFAIDSTIKTYPRHPYEDIKNAILGKRYELSLVFIGRKRARTLNYVHRHKEYVPNVLSFPLGDTTGEIYICPLVAAEEAARHGLSPDGYSAYLFIHGCLHLKGHAHGDTMEQLERRYLRRFGIT